MGKNLSSLVRVAALGALAAASVGASTVTPLNFREISTLAHQVVAGRIERVTSYKDPQTGRIMSRIEISPTRSVTGGSLAPLTFEMTGGTVGDLRQWIAGFPALEAGDRVVLFLAGDTSTPLGPTVGLWQGVFFVESDPATGAETITDHRRRPISEIRGENLVPGGASPAPRLSLDAFVQRIESMRAQKRDDARR